MPDLSDRMRLALCMGVVDLAREQLLDLRDDIHTRTPEQARIHLNCVIADLELAITKAGLRETRQLQAAE